MENIAKKRVDTYKQVTCPINTEVYYYPAQDLIQCKQNGKYKVGYKGEKAFALFAKMCRITNAKIYVISE